MRLTHVERSARRTQIVLEADILSKSFDAATIVATLSKKFKLSESYITSIIQLCDNNITISDSKRARNRLIAEDAKSLNGKHPISEIYNKLANKYKLAPSTIKYIINAQNVDLLPASSELRMDKEKQRQVSDLITQGHTIKQIAEILNCSRQNVYRYYDRTCKEEYVPVHKAKQRKEFYDKALPKVLELYREGKQLNEIAIELKIPLYVVNTIIFKADPFRMNKRKDMELGAIKPKRHRFLQLMGDLFNPQLTIRQIAKKYGKFDSCINLLISECKKCGIPLPDRVDGRTREYKIQKQS